MLEEGRHRADSDTECLCVQPVQGVSPTSSAKPSAPVSEVGPEAVIADEDLGVSRLFGRQCQDVLGGLK